MTPSPTPKSILITGAAGFIGSHTCDLLLEQGHEVIGLDDLSTGHRENLDSATKSDRFQFVEGDVLDEALFRGLVENHQPDAIIHLAGLVSVTLGQEYPVRNLELNLDSTRIVAETARISGVKRIVFASSAAVYGDLEKLPLEEDDIKEPKSNYGAAKLMSELLLQSYALSYDITAVSTRFFNVFGPRQDPHSPYSGVISIFTERYAQGKQATIFGDGLQSRDFISVYDISSGLSLAATNEEVTSGAYNLCTGVRTTLRDLTTVLKNEFPNAPDIQYGEKRTGDIKHSQGSGQKASNTLGFQPQTTFESGMQNLVKSLNTNDS